ncbi:MAG: energy transducer TonB [Gammaproteobacteria bacterium]|nr:energy transducer TonB [Pseudomonadales bacterium]MCP5347528.1 energy transducer TonB [Pseudomonadales bacterium]
MATTVNEHQNERFGFTVFLSACIHAMIILGVGFSYLDDVTSQPTMEITLAQYRSELAPEDADFLAQENQTGSGTLEERSAPSTPFTSEFNADVIQEVAPVRQAMAARQNSASTDISVLTAANSEDLISQSPEEESSEAENPDADEYTQDELSLAIASLQAQLDLQREAYARKPRKYTISSASTKKSHDALYLDSWRKRIESVGNLNYPEAARRNQIFGDLRLLVALRPDGSLNEVLILKSSNSAVLDQAAVDIVNLAAPFEPFPPELRGQYDILEIIRTWRFQEGAAFTTE